jgi:vacuolar-type H+-ATPase subunit H
MARASILDRFRPVGAPGPAGPAGIPAVDEPGHAAELAPVFAALAPELESCRRLVDEAQQQAEDTLADAQADAAAIVARARLAAASARADAYAVIEQAATEQDERTLAAACATASQLQASGAARIPGVVRRVIDRLLADRLAS